MPSLVIGPLTVFQVPSVTMLCLAPSAGCAGYRVGMDSLYPTDIHTVYVPMFESDSFRPNLGERLTEKVIKQIDDAIRAQAAAPNDK